MNDVEPALPAPLSAVPGPAERRLAREIEHKEELLASEFAEAGQRSRRHRRYEWLTLTGVALVVLAILAAAIR